MARDGGDSGKRDERVLIFSAGGLGCSPHEIESSRSLMVKISVGEDGVSIVFPFQVSGSVVAGSSIS